MSSVPTSSHLAASPTPDLSAHRVHRHRRSAAISGDFDVIGLGLFSPPPPISRTSRNVATFTNALNFMQHSAFHQRLFLGSLVSQSKHLTALDDAELDRHFHFSNADDFSNRPQQDGFHFPCKSPVIHLLSLPSSPRNFISPVRKFGGISGNLNSPIRLKNKMSASSISFPLTPKLFLTEATIMNNENIPDAVIDLDEILNANMHMTGNIEHDTELSDKNQDDFLASPFGKAGQQIFSTASYTSTSFLKQPIRELAADAIEEEEDLDEHKLAVKDLVKEDSEHAAILDDSEINTPDMRASSVFAKPQDTFVGGVYLTLSANSSNSSLPSSGGGQKMHCASMIEKPLSNSSKDLGISTLFPSNGTPSSKRSSAKASRYQSFYDQTFKISSALKYSSTESIHLLPSQGVESSGGIISASGKEDKNQLPKVLGHSSSLPSLHSNVKKSPPTRLSNIQANRDVKNSKPGTSQTSNSSNVQDTKSKSPNTANALFSYMKLSSSNLHRSTLNEVSMIRETKTFSQTSTKAKDISNSPTSLDSEHSSTVTCSGDASTDHSSVISHADVQSTRLKASTHELSRSLTPVVVVSTDQNELMILTVVEDAHKVPEAEVHRDLKRHSDHFRRPMSQSEKKVLSSTEIPVLKKSERNKIVSKLSSKGTRDDSRICSNLTERKTIPNDGPSSKNHGSGNPQKNQKPRSERIFTWLKRGK